MNYFRGVYESVGQILAKNIVYVSTGALVCMGYVLQTVNRTVEFKQDALVQHTGHGMDG